MNKLRFLFIIFKMFFHANVGGGELESHYTFTEIVVFIFYTCSC